MFVYQRWGVVPENIFVPIPHPPVYFVIPPLPQGHRSVINIPALEEIRHLVPFINMVRVVDPRFPFCLFLFRHRFIRFIRIRDIQRMFRVTCVKGTTFRHQRT